MKQGAAADNACRDGAPRGARALRRSPRAPGPPPPSSALGSRKLGVQAGRSQGWPKGADRKAPSAPPGAPSLSYGEGRKTGDGLTRQPEKTSSRDSGALAILNSLNTQPVSFRGASAASEPGIHNPKLWLWIPDRRH